MLQRKKELHTFEKVDNLKNRSLIGNLCVLCVRFYRKNVPCIFSCYTQFHIFHKCTNIRSLVTKKKKKMIPNSWKIKYYGKRKIFEEI